MARVRRIRIDAALLVLAATAFIVWHARSPGRPTEGQLARDPTRTFPLPEAAPAPHPPLLAPNPLRAPSASPESGRSPLLRPATPQPRRVEGVVQFSDGAAVGAGSSVHLQKAVGTPDRPTVVAAVAAGRFEVDLLDPAPYEVVGVMLRDTWLPAGELVAAPLEPLDGTPWTIVLPDPAHPVLRIVDTSSGLPIAGAAVLEGYDGEVEPGVLQAGHPLHDEVRRVWLGDASGLVVLSPTSKDTVVHVRAPGHVGRVVTIPPRLRGPLQLELDAGGTITVTVVGTVAAEELVIVLRSPTLSDPGPVVLDPKGHGIADGIPPGPWEVAVFRKSRMTLQLDAKPVDVRAGETVAVTLVPQSNDMERRSVQATIRVPQGWRVPISASGQHRLSVVFWGADATTTGIEREVDLDAASELNFDTKVLDLVAGKYVVFVGSPVNWRTTLIIPTDGSRLSIDVPPPRVLQVVVRDATDGRELTSGSVSWAPENTDRYPFGAYSEGVYAPLSHAYSLWIPEGLAGYVGVDVKGYDQWSADGDMVRADEPSPVRREIQVMRGGSVDVSVVVEGRAYPTAIVALRPVGESHDFHSGGAGRVDGLTAGRWTVRVEDVPGFISVLPREVEVRPGATVSVLFELKPK